MHTIPWTTRREVFERLLTQLALSKDQQNPGLWRLSAVLTTLAEKGDAPRLAELAEVPWLDAFVRRDLVKCLMHLRYRLSLAQAQRIETCLEDVGTSWIPVATMLTADDVRLLFAPHIAAAPLSVLGWVLRDGWTTMHMSEGLSALLAAVQERWLATLNVPYMQRLETWWWEYGPSPLLARLMTSDIPLPDGAELSSAILAPWPKRYIEAGTRMMLPWTELATFYGSEAALINVLSERLQAFHRASEQRIQRLQTIAAMFESDQPICVQIGKQCKGGLQAWFGGVSVFLPASQCARRTKDGVVTVMCGEWAQWIGQFVDCKLLKVNVKRGALVVSRRAWLEDPRCTDPERFIGARLPETYKLPTEDAMHGVFQTAVSWRPARHLVVQILETPTITELLRCKLWRMWRKEGASHAMLWATQAPWETLPLSARRARAFEGLWSDAQYRQDAERILSEAVQSPPDSRRSPAMFALKAMEYQPKAVEALKPYIVELAQRTDMPCDLQTRALAILAKHSEPSHIEALLELAEHPDPTMRTQRKAALELLIDHVDHARATPVLLRALRDDNKMLASKAAEQLAEIDSDAARTALLHASLDPCVRFPDEDNLKLAFAPRQKSKC